MITAVNLGGKNALSAGGVKGNGGGSGGVGKTTTIIEGSAKISFEAGKVFYNECQVKNRDLSILVLNAYAKQLEEEAKMQFITREAGLPWRKVHPTWSTWGFVAPDTSKANATDAEKRAASADHKDDGIPIKSEIKQEEPNEDAEKSTKEIKMEDLTFQGMFVLEALGASGLRSIRYSKEIIDGVGLEKVICNDLEPHAVEAMNKNISLSNVQTDKIIPNQGDAVEVILRHRMLNAQKTHHTRILNYLNNMTLLNEAGKYRRNFEADPFDVIDLDPYGSSSIFLDSAVQSVRDGGLLCITNTDLATMCGKNMEVCFSKYGSMSLKGKFGHEFAIRILLYSLEIHANRHGRFIVPLLSIQTDFYIRVFIRVYTNKAEIKLSATKLSLVGLSSASESFYLQPLGTENKGVHKPPANTLPNVCPETGGIIKIGGPIWTRPIHNKGFLETLLKMFKYNCENSDSKVQEHNNPYLSHWKHDDFKDESKVRVLNQAAEQSDFFDPNKLATAKMLRGIIVACSEELQDVPLHYSLPNMCKILRCSVPPMMKFHSALANAGYKASQVHCNPTGVKTDAPPEVLWDILRVWAKINNPTLDVFKNSNNEGADEKQVDDDDGAGKTVEERNELRDRILAKAPKIAVDFSANSEVLRRFKARKSNVDINDTSKDPNLRAEKISRWSKNPKPNWGPKSRAQGQSNLQTHKRKSNHWQNNQNGKKHRG